MNARAHRTRFAFIALPLVLALAACSGATTASGPPADSTSTREAIATSEPGPLAAVGQTFGDVSLTAPQRAHVTELFRAAEARHATAWKSSADARKALLLAVADQVQAGAIDEAQLKPKVDAVTAPMAKVRDDDRAALVELHKTLSPEQRAAFVDALPKHMRESFMGHMGKRGGPPPAAGPNDGAQPAPPPPDGEHHFAKMHMGGPLMEAWKDLDLTSDQRDQLKEIFKKDMAGGKSMREAFAGHREERKQALESFKSDKFDGAALFPAPKGDHVEQMVAFAKKALPILTPEQRAKVATMLRDRAAHASERPTMHAPH